MTFAADPATLLALAGRAEALTEYDGRLMAEIDCALRFPHLRPAEPDDHSDSPHCRDRQFNPSSIWTPTGWLMSYNYWSSVDDALLLKPKDLRLCTLSELMGDDGWAAKLAYRFKAGGLPARPGRTPAIALTSACLHAIAGGKA